MSSIRVYGSLNYSELISEALSVDSAGISDILSSSSSGSD